MFETDFTFKSYGRALKQAGFELVDAVDLTKHLSASYVRLAELAMEVRGDDEEHFQALSFVYRRMVECIQRKDVGWATYVSRKPSSLRKQPVG